MRRLTVLVSVLLLIPSCAGRVESNPSGGSISSGGTAPSSDPTAPPSSNPTAPPSSNPTAPPSSNTIDLIGDMRQDAGNGYPQLPGSAGFYWRVRGGLLLGNWFFSSTDGGGGDAVVEDIDPLHPEDGKACHFRGAQGVGVDLFAELNHPSGNPVDLSTYSGIAFRARLGGPGNALIVAFGARGQYLSNPTAFPQRNVTLSQDWQQFELPFRDFTVNASAVRTIDFVVPKSAEPFDLWVADLGLICVGACS